MVCVTTLDPYVYSIENVVCKDFGIKWLLGVDAELKYNLQQEAVSIAEPLQNRQHAQNP